MGATGYPETSVATNLTLRKMPEEERYNLRCGGSLKSHDGKYIYYSGIKFENEEILRPLCRLRLQPTYKPTAVNTTTIFTPSVTFKS